MANEAKSFPIEVKSSLDLDKTSTTSVQVTEFVKATRTARAFRALGICWAIAIFMILVPIVHFVLVPLFTLLGIFMFFQQYNLRLHLESGRIACPSCKHEMDLKPGAFDWPKREICSNCRADLYLGPKA